MLSIEPTGTVPGATRHGPDPAATLLRAPGKPGLQRNPAIMRAAAA
jgi:hypothetical protein